MIEKYFDRMKNVLWMDVHITYCKNVRIDIDDVRTLSNIYLLKLVSNTNSSTYSLIFNGSVLLMYKKAKASKNRQNFDFLINSY